MFSPTAYENTPPGGFGVLEIADPADGAERSPRFVPLRRTELAGEVAGPLASMRLTQIYGYAAEQCGETLEARYRFPLPGDAAVTRVRVSFGSVEIVAELREREKAEAAYKAAKQKGQRTALATRESPDVFTLQVAGLRPDEEVRVETSYVQLAKAEEDGWTLRVPLTTAPRYTREDEAGSRHAEGQPLALMRDPGHRFALDLVFRHAGAVTSATHSLKAAEEDVDDSLRVRLQEGEVLPDRDCVLQWRMRRERAQPALRVLTHADREGDYLYFLALIAPAVHTPGAVLPREAILLVDHSGSMEGAKWRAADWAVTQFLRGLAGQAQGQVADGADLFDLGLFHSTTKWFARTTRPASLEAIDEAITFLEKNRDSGGTEFGVALEQALGLPRDAAGSAERSRHVLVITDAAVTDAGRILRLADAEALRGRKGKSWRRISVLCIDAAPNSFLAGELAERGGGVARFLTSDPEQEDITTALDEVLADWQAPVVAGLRLNVDRGGAQAAGREVSDSEDGTSTIDLGDLPAGRPTWVAGRVPLRDAEGAEALTFSLSDAAGREWDNLSIEADGDHPAIKALFGSRRVLALEYLMSGGYEIAEGNTQLRRLGYDPAQVAPAGSDKVYAENRRREISEALRGLLVCEALEYGLASSETAFVAVRQEAGQVVQRSVAVANAAPAGWSAYPGGGMRLMGAAMPGPAASFAALAPMRSYKRRTRPSKAAGPVPQASAMSLDRTVDALADLGAGIPLTERLHRLFSGTPAWQDAEPTRAVLFDSERPEDAAKLPAPITLSMLVLRFIDKWPRPQEVDPALAIWIYVEDLASPRAKVRVGDLLRQSGRRPLNLSVMPGQRAQVVLVGGDATQGAGAMHFELEVEG